MQPVQDYRLQVLNLSVTDNTRVIVLIDVIDRDERPVIFNNMHTGMSHDWYDAENSDTALPKGSVGLAGLLHAKHRIAIETFVESYVPLEAFPAALFKVHL